jgi:hypothetical protein
LMDDWHLHNGDGGGRSGRGGDTCGDFNNVGGRGGSGGGVSGQQWGECRGRGRV